VLDRADDIRIYGWAADGVVWRGQKSWNGVAILSRSAPVLMLSELPGDPADTQSRYIEAAVNGVIIASPSARGSSLLAAGSASVNVRTSFVEGH
jgi:exonuclease III